ncbi:MAG TPA: HNH endonuclease [Armatimonadota bacterium]|nr:HNH endonuclease [Armatimonadota bacterium]
MTRRFIPAALRQRVHQDAGERCGYCRAPQHLVLAPLEIEHIAPAAAGGTNRESNLWLSCRLCNSYKGAQVTGRDPVTGIDVALYNPRYQRWHDHFAWVNAGAEVVGLTPTGRATVEALQLNNSHSVMVRQYWIAAGWHPPVD